MLGLYITSSINYFLLVQIESKHSHMLHFPKYLSWLKRQNMRTKKNFCQGKVIIKIKRPRTKPEDNNINQLKLFFLDTAFKTTEMIILLGSDNLYNCL